MFNFLQMVNHQTHRAGPRAHPRIAPGAPRTASARFAGNRPFVPRRCSALRLPGVGMGGLRPEPLAGSFVRSSAFTRQNVVNAPDRPAWREGTPNGGNARMRPGAWTA